MKVYGLWHGGHGSYSEPEHSDLEVFSSLADAMAQLATRYHSGRWNTFTYADGRTDTADTPAVSETSSMWIFLADPRASDDGDWYPDRVLSIGPRGGVRSDIA